MRYFLSKSVPPFSRVLLQWSRGLYQFRRGEFDSAASILAETLELSRTAEVLTMHAMVAALLGQALIATGRAADAFEVLSDAVGRETYRFGGKYVWTHLYLAYADARYQQGDPEALQDAGHRDRHDFRGNHEEQGGRQVERRPGPQRQPRPPAIDHRAGKQGGH